MKLYEKYFKNGYEELITYYPRFYRDVFEMVEILKAQGRIADSLEDNIERVYLNCFIDYADEAAIEKFEKFLLIGLNRSRSLEERRRLVKSYFVGFGKLSASALKETIGAYTGADVEICLKPYDKEGNNALYIYLKQDAMNILYMSATEQLLYAKIPAHLHYIVITEIERTINQPIFLGAAQYQVYKPAAIIDGYYINREIKQNLQIGVVSTQESYPDAIWDNSMLSSQ